MAITLQGEFLQILSIKRARGKGQGANHCSYKEQRAKSKGQRAKSKGRRSLCSSHFALGPLLGMCFSAFFLYNCHHFPKMKV